VKIDVSQTISILANVGVIAGILFLAVELQQNTASIEGSTYQAMSDIAVNQWQGVSQDTLLSVALSKTFQGLVQEDLSEEENSKLTFFYYGMIQRLQNTYDQYEAGLVDDRVFRSYGWNYTLFNTGHFRSYWFRFGSRTSTSNEFRQFFEEWFELERIDQSQ